ncbi:MAG: SDR family oxidoreductase [Planctomycetes bacterium]|nr:SDR family oxidoreductase [Planctomycetota bacterium]
MEDLRGKTIYLTGASRGIGRAIALRLAPGGVRLALCGRDQRALDAVAAEIERLGSPPPFLRRFDLADEAAALGFYRDAKAALGPPDILINNAGYNARKAPIAEVTGEEFDAMIAVNLKAPFLLCREAVRDMTARGSGHIVNILSTVCLFSNETMGAYTAVKKGLEGLTGVLLKEARPRGVRVSAVYPGGTDTAFRANPRPDYMKPESVADAVHAVLTLPEDLVVHGIVFRPMVETNF